RGAGGAHLGDHGVDAILLDGAQAAAGDAQPDPALLVFQPETLLVQVRQEAALLLVVGMRDGVADRRTLAGHFGDAGQGVDPSKKPVCGARRTVRECQKGVLYTSRGEVGARAGWSWRGKRRGAGAMARIFRPCGQLRYAKIQ